MYARYGLAVTLLNLSIPVTWDFSMHLAYSDLYRDGDKHKLSIPVTWDFSMHHRDNCFHVMSFNSRYLGFFHAP